MQVLFCLCFAVLAEKSQYCRLRSGWAVALNSKFVYWHLLAPAPFLSNKPNGFHPLVGRVAAPFLSKKDSSNEQDVSARACGWGCVAVWEGWCHPTSSAQLSGLWVLPHPLLPPKSFWVGYGSCCIPSCPQKASAPPQVPMLPLAGWHRHCGVRHIPGHQKLCEAEEQPVPCWPFQMPVASYTPMLPAMVPGICDVLYPSSRCYGADLVVS